MKQLKIGKNSTLTWVIVLLLSLTSCGEDFTSYSVLERLRILGVQADYPELCLLGPHRCPDGAFHGDVQIAILAADESGIVADGLHPDGPYLRDGYDLKWALCAMTFRSNVTDSPDCTQDDALTLKTTGARFRLGMADLGDQLDAGALQAASDVETKQVVAAAIAHGAQRAWAVKRLTLSARSADEQNVNPRLDGVSLENVRLVPRDTPSAEVHTGHAYRVQWHFDEATWQHFNVAYANGRTESKKELYTLSAFATAGSFSDADEPLGLWKGGDIDLLWRAPLEVPESGLDVTLAFNLVDTRGGASWTWGKVRVVRGSGILPR